MLGTYEYTGYLFILLVFVYPDVVTVAVSHVQKLVSPNIL